MDRSFTKPSTVKTTFLALHAYPALHNIQSSSSGQNTIITWEIATNPLLLPNCN